MPYTVFALKWRPQDFDQIIGQDHVVATLKNAILKNRLSHAYLFSGPRGVGKTSTARILAKSLNCKDGPTIHPCQKCSSCLEISQARSLDVIEVDGASNRGIDEIRTLRENVKFAPVNGKFKVYIIDEVHMLTTEAFNALLKTLEEPPDFVKFIFATTQPHKVIATILSRCQRLDFRRIPILEIISQLEKISNSEKIEVDKEVMFAVAKASDGSLRDAESILDQLISFSKDRVSLKDVISVLGLVEQEALFEITDKIIRKDAKATLAVFNKLIDGGKDIHTFLSNLIEHFRNLMIAKVTKGDSKLIDLPQETCEKLVSQAGLFSLEEILTSFNILINAQDMGKRLDSARIPLEISLIRLSHEKKGSAVPETPPQKQRPEPVKEKPAASEDAGHEKKRSSEVKEQSVSPSVSLEKIKEVWDTAIENLSRIKMSVATYLKEGEPSKTHGSVLTVSFPRNLSLHKEALEKKDNKELIEKNISELANADIKVNFVLSSEVKEKQNDNDNPFIKSALDMFGGRIVKED